MEVHLTKEKILDYAKTINELEVLCKKYAEVHLYHWMCYNSWSIQDNNVIINFSFDNYFSDELECDCIKIPIDEFLEICKKL